MRATFYSFLINAASSLQGVLSVLNKFSRVTELRVNWSKSQLFAIDPEAKSAAPLVFIYSG